jgi:hypothetical protein
MDAFWFGAPLVYMRRWLTDYVKPYFLTLIIDDRVLLPKLGIVYIYIGSSS